MLIAGQKFEAVKDGNTFQFTVEVKKAEDYWVELDVRSVVSWDGDTDRIASTEPYIDATIKWDGCSHVRFGEVVDPNGERSGYLHLCGAEDFHRHMALMEAIYKLCEAHYAEARHGRMDAPWECRCSPQAVTQALPGEG